MLASKDVDPSVIFTPLEFRNLTIKNRIMRSSMTGRFDEYDGTGTRARINWETKFARGGVGAIVSAHVPVSVIGRIMPNVAMLDSDHRIEFWKRLIDAVHQHDCKYIVQLSHAGRQRDISGIENLGEPGWSSTDKPDPVQGFRARRMTKDDIQLVIEQFAAAARRAVAAGADGLETHSANGYLFTQFLSPAINDRDDEYGGSLENRARFLLEVLKAIRAEVGSKVHLQVKLSAVDYANVFNPLRRRGTTIDDSIQVSKWCVEHGADAIVVSAGAFVPHPLMPPGDFPLSAARETYGGVADEGAHTFRNFVLLRLPLAGPLFRWWWRLRRGPKSAIEGMHADAAVAIRKALAASKEHDRPVLVTGGFQTASKIARLISEHDIAGVTIARPLIANPDLLEIWKSGRDVPERPCTFCNSCLIEALENPLGCYDPSRFGGDAMKMVDQVMEVFREPRMIAPGKQLPALPPGESAPLLTPGDTP